MLDGYVVKTSFDRYVKKIRSRGEDNPHDLWLTFDLNQAKVWKSQEKAEAAALALRIEYPKRFEVKGFMYLDEAKTDRMLDF